MRKSAKVFGLNAGGINQANTLVDGRTFLKKRLAAVNNYIVAALDRRGASSMKNVSVPLYVEGIPRPPKMAMRSLRFRSAFLSVWLLILTIGYRFMPSAF